MFSGYGILSATAAASGTAVTVGGKLIASASYTSAIQGNAAVGQTIGTALATKTAITAGATIVASNTGATLINAFILLQ